jgi:hypothetical protein
MSAVISVPAGRSIRRSQDSKWIDPQAEKGAIELKYEDDLMHLCEDLLSQLASSDGVGRKAVADACRVEEQGERGDRGRE